jgi:hypothetical protein
MPLPSIIHVKVSSEAAESISLSPVLVQEMPAQELVAVIVAGVGKDVARVREVLQRGIFVSGASRFRWERIEISQEESAGLLAAYPDPDPERPFNPAACVQVMLRGPATQIALEKEAAQRKRLFRRRSVWDVLMELAGSVSYSGYSYKERADVYRVTLDPLHRQRLREASRLSPYSSISKQIDDAVLDTIEFFVKR